MDFITFCSKITFFLYEWCIKSCTYLMLWMSWVLRWVYVCETIMPTYVINISPPDDSSCPEKSYVLGNKICQFWCFLVFGLVGFRVTCQPFYALCSPSLTPSLPSAPITIFLSVALKYISSVSSFRDSVRVLSLSSDADIALTWVTSLSSSDNSLPFWPHLAVLFWFSVYDNIFLCDLLCMWWVHLLCDLFYVWGVTCTLLKREEKNEQQTPWRNRSFGLTMRLRS